MLATDASLQYPDHNHQFHHYGDASDLQLGADLMQDNVPVAYYSRKLNNAPRNNICLVRKHFSLSFQLSKSLLSGCPNITVYTDHTTNTFSNIISQRVLRWRLFFDEYGVHFRYIPGATHTLAAAFFRLSCNGRQNPSTTQKAASPDLDLYNDTGTQTATTSRSNAITYRDNLATRFRSIPIVLSRDNFATAG
jgi:hypothetical protein